jgi:hypothetical protein
LGWPWEESGAGVLACRTGAGPLPIRRLADQARTDRVVLDVSHNTIELVAALNSMVKGLVLPERLSGPVQNQVGFPRRGPFQPPCDHWQGDLRLKEDMNVIGHDHPSVQHIKLPAACAMQQGFLHQPRYARVPEPDGSGGSVVCFSVDRQKDPACAFLHGFMHSAPAVAGDRTGQAPGDKQGAFFGEVGTPVRKPSAVEHRSWQAEAPAPQGEQCCTGGEVRNESWQVKTPAPQTLGEARMVTC